LYGNLNTDKFLSLPLIFDLLLIILDLVVTSDPPTAADKVSEVSEMIASTNLLTV